MPMRSPSKVCAAVAALAGPCLLAQALPHAPSEHFAGVEFDVESRQQHGLGSDQWPMTVGPDGHLYAAWGDGWGWTREPDDPKRSMGVTRIVADPDGLRGEDLWGVGPGSGFAKPEALIATESKIYLFWTSGDSRNDEDRTRLAISDDLGKSWDLGEERSFPGVPPGFRVRSIVQGVTSARSEWFFIYFGHNRASDLYLARVRRTDIAKLESYQWFAGVGPAGGPKWTAAIDDRQPAFSDPRGYIWHVGVTYNSALDTYLLTKPHFADDDDREVLNAADSRVASFGVFDAPTPWGPWSTIHYQDNFLDDKVKFSYFIPTPFISGDGLSFWLAFSGWPEYDNVNWIRGRLLPK